MTSNGQVRTAIEYADEIMIEIERDMTIGFEWGGKLPRDVGSFTALHDHCDANDYIRDAMGDIALDFDSEASGALVNAVTDEVDKRLAAMAAEIHVSKNSVFVVVTFPDSEARDAARIESVEIRSDVIEPDSTQLVYCVAKEGESS